MTSQPPFPQRWVAIHSAPRSGSSWLGQIFKSSKRVEFRYQPLFSYAFKGFLDERSDRGRILEFLRAIHGSEDDYIHQRVRDVYVEYPDLGEREQVTHLVYKEVRYHHVLENVIRKVPEMRVVGLVRHPCAVLDSWLNAPREFKDGWSVEEEWRFAPKKNAGLPEEFNGFERWLELTRIFLRLEMEFADQFMVVRYHDLNSSPHEIVPVIFEHCGLPIGEETHAFIDSSRSKEGADANSIYRLARADVRWQERLPAHIADEVLSRTREAGLDRFLQ